MGEQPNMLSISTETVLDICKFSCKMTKCHDTVQIEVPLQMKSVLICAILTKWAAYAACVL